MGPGVYNQQERKALLELARSSISNAVLSNNVKLADPKTLSENLKTERACFVTLTIHGNLRGCIGSLEAYQPLYQDVQLRAIQAALDDSRFQPLSKQELEQVKIEISVLTEPALLEYDTPDQLPTLLRPHIDGVILQDGNRRATFLPQVWQQLPNKEDFLARLCQKMGASADHWKTKLLQVFTYQVEEFSEH